MQDSRLWDCTDDSTNAKFLHLSIHRPKSSLVEIALEETALFKDQVYLPVLCIYVSIYLYFILSHAILLLIEVSRDVFLKKTELQDENTIPTQYLLPRQQPINRQNSHSFKRTLSLLYQIFFQFLKLVFVILNYC